MNKIVPQAGNKLSGPIMVNPAITNLKLINYMESRLHRNANANLKLYNGLRRHHIMNATQLAAVSDDQASTSETADDWIEIGVVGPPHGVRGEMKVQPFTDFPEDRLATPGPRWLQAPAPKLASSTRQPISEVQLEWGRAHVSKGHDVWLVKLEGVDSPEEATLLRGHSLLIPASMRDELEDEDEFYVQDLVGLNVFLKESGEQIGVVVDIFDGTGAHDVLRISLVASTATDTAIADKNVEHQVLVPFVKEIVPMVDIKGNRMEIEPPEGLLDLAMPVKAVKQTLESRGKRIKKPVSSPKAKQAPAE